MLRTALAAACLGLASAYEGPTSAPVLAPAPAPPAGPFKLPPLPYAYEALEPFIDSETMHLHHDKHMAKYVDELNLAVASTPFAGLSLESMLYAVGSSNLPANLTTPVRNNGGGFANHIFFFDNMAAPGSNGTGAPVGKLAEMINSTFGNFTSFKQKFSKEAAGRFGSGFAWLLMTKEGKLTINSTANQDSPMMTGLPTLPHGFPIIGIDVWEHAYYLKYKNVRADYIKNWWNIVNWNMAESNFQAAAGGKSTLKDVY